LIIILKPRDGTYINLGGELSMNCLFNEDKSKFKDIPNHNDWKYIRQINKGFSSDSKYYIKTKDDKEFFLRLSDISLYNKKKEEHEIIKLMKHIEISSLQEVDFGVCNNGKNVYMLQTWINGVALESVLPTLSGDNQYKLGIEGGRILKKIHSIKSREDIDWYSVRVKKYLSSYEKYKQHGIEYKYENQINEYVNLNVHLLKNIGVSLVHGDYHVGNMILNSKENITIIDYDRIDWKAPIEDFYKLGVFSRNISVPFSRGQIDGYTDNNPSVEFWEMYCLSMAMTSFLSLLWGKIRSEDMYNYRKKLCDTLVEDHNCFKEIIPRWYRS